MFRYEAGYVINERGKVMDVKSNLDRETQNIQVWNKNGGLNQQWDIVFVDDWKDEPGKGELNEEFGFYVERPFYIVSELPKHRYLEVVDSHYGVIKTRNGNNQQLWYFDQKTLSIRSKQFGRGIAVKHNGGSNQWLLATPKTNCWEVFRFEKGQLCAVCKNKCMTVQSAQDKEMQKIVFDPKKQIGAKEQQWKIVYADDAKDIVTKGKNDEFGWECNKPFYIVSRLPMHRVIETRGNHALHLWKHSYGRQPSQQFYFDCVSKTLKSQQTNIKQNSITISGNRGAGNHLLFYRQTSRWW
jgi:hypothetical protein